MPTSSASTHVFVAPDLDGPETGGTLYNARLIAALRARGVVCSQLALDAALEPGAIARGACVWVDSLYLEALPGLRARSPDSAAFLIVHYLPAQLARGRAVEWQELSAPERAALEHAAGFLVTSRFMAEQLARCGLGARKLLCVEPGVELPDTPAAPATAELRGVMLCNVVDGKGVLPLLRALGELARAQDRFSLAIAGALDAEPAYAQACVQLIAADPGLRARVVLRGTLRHGDALSLLQRSDVLLSASRMEAFGMALAEARAAGVPIVARNAGNSAALVTAESGGMLLGDERAVAAEFLALVRDRARLAAARARAAAARMTRSWHDAAGDFCAQLAAR